MQRAASLARPWKGRDLTKERRRPWNPTKPGERLRLGSRLPPSWVEGENLVADRKGSAAEAELIPVELTPELEQDPGAAVEVVDVAESWCDHQPALAGLPRACHQSATSAAFGSSGSWTRSLAA